MEKNLKLICPKCGTPHQPHSPHTMDADGTALDAVEEKCISISKGKALLYQITAGAKVMFRMHLRI